MPVKPSSSAPKPGRPPKVAVSEIIDVAVELFGTRGVRGTSIAAVAARLGLTDAGVHHYFPTKRALVEAVIERALALQMDQMQAIVAPGGLAAFKGFREWGAVVEKTPELVALQVILSSDAILTDSIVRKQIVRRYTAVHDLATGLIREGMQRGEIRRDIDAGWEASALIAYLDGIRLQWFYSRRQLPLAETVRHYVDLVVDRLTDVVPASDC
jgi:AcrR family transcriptional regulator